MNRAGSFLAAIGLVGVVIFACPACSNSPGSLTLEVHAAPEFRENEPVRFETVVRSKGPTVCLARDYCVRAEIKRMNDAHAEPLKGHSPIMVGCIHSSLDFLVEIPFQCIEFFDVADVGGRFVCISPKNSDSKTHLLKLSDYSGDRPELWSPESDTNADPMDRKWTPGEYSMRVTLESNPYGEFEPACWQTYSHEVVGETRFKIVDFNTTGSRPAVPRCR